MKVFLDDIRMPPDNSWVIARGYQDAIYYLKTGKVTTISLDHDLGEQHTGYDVCLWIEEKVFKKRFYPPTIYVHSANPVGRRRIEQSISKISTLVPDVPFSH